MIQQSYSTVPPLGSQNGVHNVCTSGMMRFNKAGRRVLRRATFLVEEHSNMPKVPAHECEYEQQLATIDDRMA